MGLVKELWRDKDMRYLIVLPILVLFAFLVVAVVSEARTGIKERACLRHGYPSARVTWQGFGTAFCVRRVDQTDEVVPLETLP